MPERHQADRTRLSDFADEVLVVCPACEGRALVRLLALDEPLREGPFRAGQVATLTCSACGYGARRPVFVRWRNEPVDPAFRRPVWLQHPCGPGTLWAYNPRHLDAIERFVRAKLRERRPDPEEGWRNASWASRIPRWISAAGNRELVLRCIARMRRERLER